MLQVNAVNFAYSAGAPLIRELNLAMSPGDLLGLLGPNGAGKTTLVSLFMGLIRPAAGTIDIMGEPPRLGRADIALVPQEYAFYERLSGRENLTYFAGVLGFGSEAATRAVNEALADCKLNEVADQKAGHYSGGLKRRLNFAIALLQSPKLLILDEPTAGVDPHSRSFLLELVREKNRAGVSVIYTSHLLDEVQSLCNRIAVMDRGRVVAQGTTEELLSANAQRLVVTLDRPLTAADAAKLSTVVCEDCKVQFALDGARTPASVLQQLEHSGYRVTRIHYGERRLEELFFDLTARELRDS